MPVPSSASPRRPPRSPGPVRAADADALPLILTEDRALSIRVGARIAHLLPTRGWLAGLEGAVLIPSAEAVIAQIASHGRAVSGLLMDRPAGSDAGTSWLPPASA